MKIDRLITRLTQNTYSIRRTQELMKLKRKRKSDSFDNPLPIQIVVRYSRYVYMYCIAGPSHRLDKVKVIHTYMYSQKQKKTQLKTLSYLRSQSSNFPMFPEFAFI